MHLVSVGAHEIFQALSDPFRVRMMRLLAVSNEEACLCEFSDSLLEPEYKLSRHLKVIRQAGLLEANKEGRWIYHRLIRKVPFLEHVYEALRKIPDTDGEFRKDLERFSKRLPLREDGRCKAKEPAGNFIKNKKRNPR